MRYLLLSVLVVCMIGIMVPSVLGDEIFDRKKTDILSSLGYNQGFPYHFGLDRDFTKEQGVTETNYQLYKVIDSQTNKHVGDLRFYLGSSEWWDENAELQEDDTSGFENIFKVKIHLMHKTEPVMAQQMTDHLTTALHILVPEWSNEVDDVIFLSLFKDVSGSDVLDYWFVDSINFSERNENGKRENSIFLTENKEIKVFHDDLDYGSITVIVTENADTISLGGVSTESDVLDELLSAEKTVSEESKISGGCGEGTVLVNGVCQLAEPVDASRPDTFTGMMFVLIVVGILSPVIIIPLIRYRKSKNNWKKQVKKTEQYPEKQKPRRKPAKKKETSASCSNCGKKLKPTAKFCGSCGTKA
jgi:hypothetical protein